MCGMTNYTGWRRTIIEVSGAAGVERELLHAGGREGSGWPGQDKACLFEGHAHEGGCNYGCPLPPIRQVRKRHPSIPWLGGARSLGGQCKIPWWGGVHSLV